MVWGLVAGLTAAGLFGSAAVLQAHAIRGIDDATHSLRRFVTVAMRHPLILLVVATYLAGFVLHAVAIWLLPLYLAQTSIALALPVSAVVARRVEEPVSVRQWLGVGAVVAGLVLLALGAGDPGAVRVSPTFVAALYAGLVALFLARLVGPAAGAWYGALSGLAYAGSASAVRGVTWQLDLLVVAALLAVSAYGLLGFWLYSTGLERAAVPSVTAPQVVGQTAVPGVVGVALLGDGVRSGWWLAVALGLALATLGAVLVALGGSNQRLGAEPVQPS